MATSERIFIILVLTAIQFYTCNSLKILLFAPGISKSHMMFNYRIASTLINQGHEVIMHTTVMYETSIGDIKAPSQQIKEIRQDPPPMSESMKQMMADGQAKMLSMAFKPSITASAIVSMAGMMYMFNHLMGNSCKVALNNYEILEKLRSEKFDIALSHNLNLCPVAISHMIGVKKFIWISPGTYIFDNAADQMRVSTNPSYIPNAMSRFTDQMSFMERVQNIFLHWIFMAFTKLPIGAAHTEKKLFSTAVGNTTGGKTLVDIASDSIATMFINGEEILDYPRPFLPGMLFTGPLEQHAKTTALDEKWTALTSEAQDGVIMFSLGSIANTSLMPIEMKEAFLDAFKNFSTYTIIWKLEGEMPNGLEEQKHIKIAQWLPQRDLLYSGRVKLFITHGGYNSLLETAQSGVPMLLLPLFGDQQGNAKRAVRHGIGLELDKGQMDAHTIFQKMDAILNDSKYAQRSRKLAKVMHDKIIENEKAIIRQIERIARNKWWPIPRSRHLNFFQLHCLDIIITFVIIAVTLSWVLIRALKSSVSIVCNRK